MLGQFLALPRAWAPGAPGAPEWALVEVLAGGVVELVVVAALAIAAPPPATAAVTASVVSNGLIR
jgi:hypothetical protein